MESDREYGLKLCDALMNICGAGHHDLPNIVEQLTRADVAPPGAPRWTPELLSHELQHRAAAPDKPSIICPVSVDGSGRNDDGQLPARLLDAASTGSRSEYLVRYGLRNQWYIVAASSEITDKALALTRLGERMVLWRDLGGIVHALEDICPHRGIALSAGEARDDVISCAYHGVQVNGSGRVVKVPAMANCPLEGQKLVRHYPVVEHYQAIWAYFGDAKHPLPPALDLPEELVSREWTGELHVDVWNGNYQYVNDNLCDPMHGPYLHGRSYTQQYGPKDDQIKISRKEHGFEVFREGQRGVNFDWMEMVHADSNYYARVEIPLPPSAGPGGPMGIIFYVTPIDDRRTRINAWRLRKVTGWQKDLWHFLFEHRLRDFVDAVLAQDKIAMDNFPPWPAPENLYQHDIGATRMRRHIRDMANRQAELLSAKTD